MSAGYSHNPFAAIVLAVSTRGATFVPADFSDTPAFEVMASTEITVAKLMICLNTSGHVFLFSNAQRNRLKLLFYDGSGLWVCAKRLDRGRFRWPAVESEQVKVVLSPEELVLLLGGIDLSQAERRRWHRVMTTPENIST